MLAPDLAAVQALAARLAALPEVARTTTLADFIPAQQTEKLAPNRAEIYSAGTKAAAFGVFALSPHPGTAS